MKHRMRHQVYDAIVERLADHGWHDTRELGELTHYPEEWLEELTRDPQVEVDSTRRQMRLRAQLAT